VPSVADARQDEPRPVFVGHRGREPDLALDQFEPDPVAGRLRVPCPALDAGRLTSSMLAVGRAGASAAWTDIG
jgi:hypothetical protein